MASDQGMLSSKPAAVRQNREGVADVKTLINSAKFKEQLANALPKHITPERFVRVVTTQLLKNPDLAKCTQESLISKILECASFGVEADGRLAHLVPRWSTKKGVFEATLVIDYKGYVDLMFRGGFVTRIHADVVYEGDLFVYKLGQVIEHTPWAWRTDKAKPRSRGEVKGAFCLIALRNAEPKCEVMTEQEIQLIRGRSASPNSGPWVTDTDEMRKKTVLRRAQKWVPLSSEYRDKIDHDDDNTIEATPTVIAVEDAIGRADYAAQPQHRIASQPEVAIVPAESVAEPVAALDTVTQDKPQKAAAKKRQEPFAELSGDQL